MNENSIEIPLVKATYEELQEVICELQVERYKYKTTIDKIKEYIENELYSVGGCVHGSDLPYEAIEPLKELLEEIE